MSFEPEAFRHEFPPKPIGAKTILTLCGVCAVGLGAIIWSGKENDKQSMTQRAIGYSRSETEGGFER